MLGRRCVSVAVALALMMPLGVARAQSDEDKAAARSLATQGAEAFTANKFEEAVDLVSRAEALVHAPTHLLLIARAQTRLGRLVAAKETYLKIIREDLPANAPGPFKKAQQDAKDELAAIDPKIASLLIEIEGAGSRKVTVKLDDQPVAEALVGVHRPIDPGKHMIVAYVTGLKPIEQAVTLEDGEKKDVKLTVPASNLPSGLPLNPADDPDADKRKAHEAPPPPSGGGPKMGFVIGGAAAAVVGGAAAGVLGAIFLPKSSDTQAEGDSLFAACSPNCSSAQQDAISEKDSDAASQKTIGLVGLIGGGALFLGGGALIVVGLVSKSAPAPQKSAWIAPYATPNQIGVYGAF